jgi:sugar transferase (PEP-CTERM/EpsH1 system associated)
MRLLFLTARMPYPPIRGDALVPFHRLKRLSRKHEITLLTFYESDKELDYLDKLEPFCSEIITVKHSRWVGLFNMMVSGLFNWLPFQVLYYKSRPFKMALEDLLAGGEFDLLHVHMLRIAEYGLSYKIPKILEMIDSMDLNIQRRVSQESFPLSWLLGLELRRLRRYEAPAVRRYGRGVVVSALDRRHVGEDNVVDIPLGVDLQRFRPVLRLTKRKTIVFTGSMFYFPNENAILWFVKHCFAGIKKRVPDVELVVAGKDPGPAVLQLAEMEGVRVTGFVEDMEQTLHEARIAIAPMQSGSGMQFKILDAMACGIPVVATQLGVGAIQAKHGRDLLVADRPEDFINACVRLLEDDGLAERLRQSGRRLVEGVYTWEANVERIEQIYDDVLAEHRRAMSNEEG